MPELRELSYRELTRRLRKLGFRFYRHGKGSHECGCATLTEKLYQSRIIGVKISVREQCERLSGKSVLV